MISLYFHIPFCTRKCDYCHFFVLPDKEPLKQQLMQGLKQEWQLRLPDLAAYPIATVYFGGGTPALFGPARIAEILRWLPGPTPQEITLEANPENITSDLMKAYVDAGINRVSIGIQTLDTALLHTLGRLHTSSKACEAVITCFEAGIHNISIDLMYDLPGQTLHHWTHTLQQVKNLPLTHLSLYNLTIEPHTVFFKHREKLQKSLPNEQISLAMYETALTFLHEAGLEQYEISAFAKPGYQSQHNVGYWTARPFLGFGPSAFSYWQGKRFRNVAHLGRYCRSLESGSFPCDFEEELEFDKRQNELMAIQLRLVEGVDIAAFERSHGPLHPELKETLHKLEEEGYIKSKGARLSLTKRGILFYDTVAVEIV